MLNNKTLLRNTLLLTAASLLLRALGLAFQSFITGQIGSAGTGLFSLAMSASSLAVTFATSGIRYAVTRVVSEQATINPGQVRPLMRRAYGYAAVLSTIALTALFYGADTISLNWVGDARVATSLKIMAFGLPFTALSGVMGGYFIATRKVGTGVVGNVIEELVTIAAAMFLVPRAQGSLEFQCASIMVAAVIGDVANFAISGLLYTVTFPKQFKGSRASSHGLTSKLVNVAAPIALSAYVRTGLSTVQHMLVPNGLKRSGMGADAALATHGVIHAMVFPVLLFPSVLMVSAAETLIPELTEAQVSGNKLKVRAIVNRTLKEAFYFSFGCAMLFFCFGGVIGKALFGTTEAGEYIRGLAPLVLVMYMDMITDGMLKGLGEQFYSMCVNILDSSVSVILVWITLPIWGIKAYLFMIVSTEIFNFALSAYRLRKITADDRVRVALKVSS